MFEGNRSKNPREYPQLHSKGAQCRHCFLALHLVLQDHIAVGDADFEAHRALLFHLKTFYEVIEHSGRHLSANGAAEAHRALLRAGVLLQRLSHNYMMAGRHLFHVTMKAHFMAHIGLDCVTFQTNPRFSWTYGDEDLMGRIAAVARSSTRGRGPLRLGQGLYPKYRTLLYLIWTRLSRP